MPPVLKIKCSSGEGRSQVMQHTHSSSEQTRFHILCAMQTDINENMRAILIDWLVEVHYKFKVSAMKEHSSGSAVPRLHCMLSSASLIKLATPASLCLQASSCLQALTPGVAGAAWADVVPMHMQLMPERPFPTDNLIDRFLEKKRVSRRNLQLVRALSEAPGAPVFCTMCSHSLPAPCLPGVWTRRCTLVSRHERHTTQDPVSQHSEHCSKL